ncbi:uncharacterized protein OGAPODRAFT_7490 [Ogataea polymorpha]|uniref:uncharacterized protein n=1 Tax=Ogataea polymorpha TaxID=460523 RepID=UPI0007F4E575|nr:uncharacterized protein OGAPODRAFT_7490 [Ogataea polymorpha]OBA16210.1 hypothetical protein OGAPODRAFT_7490 [Ogataea polymorpha]
MDGLSLFCYGPTGSPDVVYEVLDTHPDCSNLHIYKARLPDHKQVAVRNASYSAVIPHQGDYVDGLLVDGLSDQDLRHIDYFEGYEFASVPVKVQLIDPIDIRHGDHEGRIEINNNTFKAGLCYIWNDSYDRLEL